MPSINAFRRRALMTCLLLASLVPVAIAANGTVTSARQTWQLLDYIAVDYAGAVQGRRVVSPAEYAEMREFAGTVRANVAALPATPGRSALVVKADGLVGKGVAALQEAGWVAQALVALPRIEWLGVYPTWQSL